VKSSICPRSWLPPKAAVAGFRFPAEDIALGAPVDTRGAPGLLAEESGQPQFQLLDAGGLAGCAFLRGKEVGLRGGTGDDRSGHGMWLGWVSAACD
jgi:hypothetical protein